MDSSLHGIKYVIPKYSGKLSHRIWFFRVNPPILLVLSVFFLMHFPVMEERALIAVIVLSCFPQIWLL